MTYGKRENDPGNMRFLSIWKQFPLDYQYIEAGEEPDGHIALVVVLADGYDRETRRPRYAVSEWCIRESFYSGDLDPSLRKVITTMLINVYQ